MLLAAGLAASSLLAPAGVELAFEAPVSVLGGLPEHADHFYTIPPSQEPPSPAPLRLTFSAVVTKSASGVGVSTDGATWSLEDVKPSVGQVFPGPNGSCLHTLGAVEDAVGPSALHGTYPPRTAFSSNYSDAYCVGADGRLTRSREPRPVRFRGLPFSVIRMTTAETGWSRLPSGRIVHTPYVHVSEHDILHQPASAFRCCLNWTCPCGRMVGEICQCPPQVPKPCAPGSVGPGVPPPKGHSPKGLCRNFSVVAFSSDDGGYTFDYLSVVASNQDYPQFEEGPNENALVTLGSGDLLSIIRIEGGDGLPHMRHMPLLSTRSSDGGTDHASEERRRPLLFRPFRTVASRSGWDVV